MEYSVKTRIPFLFVVAMIAAMAGTGCSDEKNDSCQYASKCVDNAVVYSALNSDCSDVPKSILCKDSEICSTDDNNEAYCKELLEATCDPDSFASICQDKTSVITCSAEGTQVAQKCEDSEKCAVSMDGNAVCIDKDIGLCDPDSFINSCESDELGVYCDSLGHIVTHTCGDNQKCALIDTGGLVCINKTSTTTDPGNPCNIQTFERRCDHTKNIGYYCSNETGKVTGIQCESGTHCFVDNNFLKCVEECTDQEVSSSKLLCNETELTFKFSDSQNVYYGINAVCEYNLSAKSNIWAPRNFVITKCKDMKTLEYCDETQKNQTIVCEGSTLCQTHDASTKVTELNVCK